METSVGRPRQGGSPAAQGLPDRLATLIVERARTLRLDPGDHLTEQDLADSFRVSRTPVRAALRILERTGVLEQLPNRGFFLRRAIDRLPGRELPFDESPDDLIYFRIAEDRLAGRLDIRFSEAELARRYELSKSRLARLLARMSREGWLERLPGHGWAFQPVLTSRDAYEQSYRFRILIEPAALMEPGYRVDKANFERVRAQQRAMLDGGIRRFSSVETFQIGATLHEALVAASGNIFLIDAIRRVNRVRRLIEYRIHKDRGRLVRECTDHLHLLDLLERGERAEAAAFLRKHLERVRNTKLDIARRADRTAPPQGR
jgi:DNA-binding GntR family transcriptional regulator